MRKTKLSIIAMVTAISILLGATLAFAAEADYGSQGALATDKYTLEEMLRYAIQDEYLAKAEYDKIMDVYGTQRPFSNIIRSEDQHIALLTPLFEKYGYTLPKDTSSEHVAVPDSLLEAMQTGVTAEINNINMYKAFLKQDLPADVETVFTRLAKASESHLKAFENGVDRNSGSNATTAGNSRRGAARSRGGRNR